MSKGIYAIKNIFNGMIYVGGSTNIEQRIRKHKCELKLNKHSSAKLQGDYNVYGENNFVYIILELVEHEALHEREQFWNDELKCNVEGYNRRPDVRSNKGIVLTEETKMKIRKNKPDTRGENNGMFGKTHTEDVRKKLSENHKGKLNAQYGKGYKHQGTKNGRAKIKESDIYYILKLLDDGLFLKDIAMKYNVSLQTIWKIKEGISWTHITNRNKTHV